MTAILDRLVTGSPTPGHRITVTRLDGSTTMELADLWAAAGRVAAGLRGMGVGPGDRIGIMAANGLGWVLLDLAAVRIGAVVAGLEPGKFDVPEVAAGLRERHRLVLVFADRPHDLPGHHPIALVADLAAAEAPAPPPVVRGALEPFAVKFTSGSTGVPKSMTASTGSVETSLAGVQELFAHGPGDDLFVFLPLSLLQQRYWVYSALVFGHDVTITSYEAAFVTMGRSRPTVVMGVPAFFEAARRQIQRRGGTPEAARAVFGDRIRYLWTGSAPAAPDMIEFFTAVGLPIFEGYGLNETCIATKNAPGATRAGSVGRALPGRRIVIADDGVVQVHSDHPVATGYDDAPDGGSERVFVASGVVRTGDLGRLDDDGYLYLQGRADDVIVLGNGRKVVVRPIEEFLRSSPAVGHAVLFCPTDSRIVAVISPADGAADPAAIREHVARSNATFAGDEQITRVVVAREPFTVANDLLTSQHKPRRSRISETYHDELTHSHTSTDSGEEPHVRRTEAGRLPEGHGAGGAGGVRSDRAGVGSR